MVIALITIQFLVQEQQRIALHVMSKKELPVYVYIVPSTVQGY